MRFIVLLVALIFLILAQPFCLGQASKRPQNGRYVVAPSENSLLTVASQPDCPLVIQDAQFLINVDVSWDFKFSYQLVNRGQKPIRKYTVFFWTSEGGGGTLLSERLERGLLAPGESITIQPPRDTVVSLTPELRRKLKLGLPMKVIVVLLVEDIEFTDGTKFSDATTLNALKRYFEDRH